MAIIARMKISKLTRAGHGLAALVLIASGQAALAVPVSWVGGDGGWEDAARWSGSALPSASDFVTIDGSPVPTVTSNAIDNVALELTNRANLSVDGGKLTVVGTADIFGQLAVKGGAALDTGRITIQSGGGFDVTGGGISATVNVTQGIFNYGTWTVGHGGNIHAESIDNFNSFHIEGITGTFANSMINHAGASATIMAPAGSLNINGSLINEGTMLVNDRGRLATVTIDNRGSLTVQNDAVLATGSQINDGHLTIDGGAFYTATHLVTNNGTIKLNPGTTANIAALDNHAVVDVDGATLGGQRLNNALDGALSLTQDAKVTFDEVISASRFGISIDGVQATLKTGKFQQLSGTTSINSGTLGASGEFGVQIAGGDLIGHGTIAGKLVMSVDGVLNPGDSADPTGHFDVSSGLDLLGGRFAVDLGGTNPTDYDVLNVHGAATLGGKLNVALLSGYTPVLGDAFDIILADSITGAFGTILLPTLSDGLKFTTLNGGTFFRLQVAAVPLPAPALLLGGALGALGFVARRRQRV